MEIDIPKIWQYLGELIGEKLLNILISFLVPIEFLILSTSTKYLCNKKRVDKIKRRLAMYDLEIILLITNFKLWPTIHI